VLRRVRFPAVAFALAIALGGCGLGGGPGSSKVTLTITRGFGSRQVSSATEDRLLHAETVLAMLQRKFPNIGLGTARPTGRAVESIDGLSAAASQTGWFFWVNGVRPSNGPGLTALHSGDRVWWDLHDESATNIVRAVVGSYPEPFQRGINGQRLPTTLECGNGVSTACKLVEGALDRAGVPVASQYIGTGSGPDTLGVVVGTWPEINSEVASELLDYGPSASGVYARFGAGGRTLLLLNPKGQVARTFGAGAGLVAATADSQSVPTWLITGTNTAGVIAAARALNATTLHDHFAVAVQGTTDVPLPVEPQR
jgi:Domain of unknown function (DUF4430)